MFRPPLAFRLPQDGIEVLTPTHDLEEGRHFDERKEQETDGANPCEPPRACTIDRLQPPEVEINACDQCDGEGPDHLLHDHQMPQELEWSQLDGGRPSHE